MKGQRRELDPKDLHGCAGLVMGFAFALMLFLVCAVIYFLVFA